MTENFIVVPGPLVQLVGPIVHAAAMSRSIDQMTGRIVPAVVGDIGPATHLGEVSIAVAKAFGVNADPKTGGIDDPRFLYKVFPRNPRAWL